MSTALVAGAVPDDCAVAVVCVVEVVAGAGADDWALWLPATGPELPELTGAVAPALKP